MKGRAVKRVQGNLNDKKFEVDALELARNFSVYPEINVIDLDQSFTTIGLQHHYISVIKSWVYLSLVQNYLCSICVNRSPHSDFAVAYAEYQMRFFNWVSG